MKLPKKKKIFGTTWQIKLIEYPMSEQLMPVNGKISEFSKVITIKKDLPKDQRLRAYVEMILKASFYEQGLEADHEAFARQLLALFKMTPK